MTASGSTEGPPSDAAVVDAAERHGGRIEHRRDGVRWWITDPDSAAEDTAAHLGLTEHRRLYQMRRPLPLDPPAADATQRACANRRRRNRRIDSKPLTLERCTHRLHHLGFAAKQIRAAADVEK